MSKAIYSVIAGTGNYIPTKHISNEDFLGNEFYDSDGTRLEKENQEIIDKFFDITTISERRYVTDDLVTSDIACYAAIDAIKSAAKKYIISYSIGIFYFQFMFYPGT